MDALFSIQLFNEKDASELTATANEPHTHDFEELLVGMEGNLEHFIDFQSAEFTAPYISFVTKGKLHRAKPAPFKGKCNIWLIKFASEFLPDTTFRLYSYYHDHATLAMNDDVTFRRMVSLCEIMNNEMEQPNPTLTIVHDLLHALFTMIRVEQEKRADDEVTIPKTKSITFKNFLSILEDNFRRAEGVDFYAEKLFMSSRNLNLICQSILHKSVSEIIETRKLIEAKNLLINTEKSISEIGFELGYNEKAYFTNVFRKKIGKTPSEFREEMQKIIS